MGDGWEVKSGSACSPVGNWCSLIFPEALPERLHSITYLANIGNIHDGKEKISSEHGGLVISDPQTDATDEVTVQEAQKDHQLFSRALDADADSQTQARGRSDKAFKWKNLLAKCVLEIITIDHDMGKRMIESYRSKWLDTMEDPNYDAIDNLDDYLAFRMLNGGMRFVFPTAYLALGHPPAFRVLTMIT